ncbi:hypothetical protein [Bacillus sp. AG4(2022)]|uniref:hypothetical protein n=1 Tax=Bacillus sp. AG4(2022) TaxID=2962594 RepID=UPI002881676C|nr:hypothetical protein [Bacillus sp. AG4(2022)]MDT0160278.1 hypothetical protein [Bacillus sp. AG4(2022)]
MDLLNGKVRVYNYELSPVGFPSQHNAQGVFVRGRDEDEEFVVERVSLDDIEAENTKSDLFKVGRLRFNPEEEEEVYKKLGIEDRENIKTDVELIEQLKDDSVENIRKISNLKSSTLLTRMKSLLFRMERAGSIPPHTVSSVVLERNNELKYGGKRNPDSEINRLLDADKKKNDDDALKKTVAELSKKIESMEKEKAADKQTIQESTNAIQDLLKMVNDLKSNTPSVEKEPEPVKKAGRPKKNS